MDQEIIDFIQSRTIEVDALSIAHHGEYWFGDPKSPDSHHLSALENTMGKYQGFNRFHAEYIPERNTYRVTALRPSQARGLY